ncbi:hypothetical protein DFH06DRAFT_1409463 [Mycena polygramma]|nr:hypothetical protein DFH06DRAFT_1409463 [Mycena polygramma]
MSSFNPSSFTESPFRKHFDTNYVPLDAELELIRAHLLPHETELARLDSLIHTLTVQRNRVNDYIQQHKALTSHPRRLPQDVLEQIFLACLPTRHNAVMSPSEVPLVLGRICSTWRSIAFATPRLWASLHISTEFIARSSTHRNAAFICWLNRSAPLPLSLSIAYPHGHQNSNTSILEHLISFSARWSVLRISNLTYRLHFEPPLSIRRDSYLRTCFAGRVRQKITIVGTMLTGLVPITLFKWDHLTHLTLRGNGGPSEWPTVVHTLHAHRLLQGCTRLISLDLCLYSFDIRGPQMGPFLTPHLESLTIVDWSPHFRALEVLVDWFIMPRLGQFHVAHIEPSKTIPARDAMILERLANRSPLISDLSLNLSDFAAPSFIQIIQFLPRLTKLRVVLWGPIDGGWSPELKPMTADLLSALTPTASAPHPCPALEELITESDWLRDDVLVNFLQAHLNHGTNLRRFELGFHCGRPEIIPDVELFRMRGLEVCLRYKVVDEGPKSNPWEGIE